jgi:RHS repeat-associated protein
MTRSVLVALLLLATISGFSQEYVYDGGNLSKDGNKKIRSIHYNYLNLADTIIFEDGRKITYVYTATGHKLSQRVIDAGGIPVKNVDYVSQTLYNNDTLRQIFQGSGRVVQIVRGVPASPWEYQYDQKDHLGNVRTLLTSRQDTENYKATLESACADREQNQFQRYEDARRINSDLFDHTKNGSTSFSQRLDGSGNEKYGLAKSLDVMPGDVVSLKVFAKYADPDMSHWAPMLADLMTQIATGAIGTVVDGTGYSTNGSTPFPFAGLSGTSDDSEVGPKAYLNWLVFDHNYTFKTGGYKKIDPNARENGSNVPHDELSAQLTIKEQGYVYVYLSNEETSPIDVFFDDFTVDVVKGPVVQQSDYDPFGLIVTESTREHEANNFLYNGKELQKDLDLNWYDYGARMYDAALGRWHVIDPLAEVLISWSPFVYVSNNPIRNTDPDGKLQRDMNGYINFEYQPRNDDEVLDPATQARYSEVLIQADDGTPINAYRLWAGTPRNVANSHGTTFTDGNLWIPNDQVYPLLDGDHYAEVGKNKAQVGDVVIISLPAKGKRGPVLYSATVSRIKNGKVTVTSKTGREPEVHEDNIDDLVARASDFADPDDPRPRIAYTRAKQTYYHRKEKERKPDPKKKRPETPAEPYVQQLKP